MLFRSLGHLAKIKAPEELAVWLYSVTKNRCRRMRRKSSHAPENILSLDELLPSDEELRLLLQDAEGNVLLAERHHLLHQAILGIPVPLRVLLVLHDMEELTTEQVAQVLKLRQRTVRIRLHRPVRKVLGSLLILRMAGFK